MTAGEPVVHRLEPYADHLAFILWDAHASEGVFNGDTWDKAEDQWRIAVERHCVVVRTARIDFVPVTLVLQQTAPAGANLDAFDTSLKQIWMCRPEGWP